MQHFDPLSASIPGDRDQRFTRRWRLGLGLLFLGLVACAERVDAPSAFTEEQYLCDAEHAAKFDEQVEECREAHLTDGSCAGIVSFQGVIESQPVVVDATLFKATSVDNRGPNGSRSRSVGLKAYAPYFLFSLELEQLPVEGFPPLPPVPATANAGESNARAFINLEVRSANYLSSLVDEKRDIELGTTEEVRAAISGGLTRGGYIDLCFHAFPEPVAE